MGSTDISQITTMHRAIAEAASAQTNCDHRQVTSLHKGDAVEEVSVFLKIGNRFARSQTMFAC